jgi:hypothetical protein
MIVLAKTVYFVLTAFIPIGVPHQSAKLNIPTTTTNPTSSEDSIPPSTRPLAFFAAPVCGVTVLFLVAAGELGLAYPAVEGSAEVLAVLAIRE